MILFLFKFNYILFKKNNSFLLPILQLHSNKLVIVNLLWAEIKIRPTELVLPQASLTRPAHGPVWIGPSS